MFVPSLSWQNDRFIYINGSKKPFSAGCLFKPVVGCNFLATSMNPHEDAAHYDSRHRPPPEEELFAPPSLQLQCSYGQATYNYFWLGVACFLPFWIMALIANTQPQSETSVFALHVGYRAWHTQLQVCCAMAWRAFANANPVALTFLLTSLIAVELALVWRWQPSNLPLLNQARMQGSVLALLWGLCSCVAAVIDDSADDRSGIFVVLVSTAWLAVVGVTNRKLAMAMCCCIFDRRLAPAGPGPVYVHGGAGQQREGMHSSLMDASSGGGGGGSDGSSGGSDGGGGAQQLYGGVEIPMEEMVAVVASTVPTGAVAVAGGSGWMEGTAFSAAEAEAEAVMTQTTVENPATAAPTAAAAAAAAAAAPAAGGGGGTIALQAVVDDDV